MFDIQKCSAKPELIGFILKLSLRLQHDFKHYERHNHRRVNIKIIKSIESKHISLKDYSILTIFKLSENTIQQQIVYSLC